MGLQRKVLGFKPRRGSHRVGEDHAVLKRRREDQAVPE